LRAQVAYTPGVSRRIEDDPHAALGRSPQLPYAFGRRHAITAKQCTVEIDRNESNLITSVHSPLFQRGCVKNGAGRFELLQDNIAPLRLPHP